MSSEDGRTVWAGNLDDKVTEEVLYELFLQAGPLQYVRHPKDKQTGRKKNFAFVCYRQECSVPYAIELLNEIKLYGRNLRVQSRHLKDLQSQGLAPYGAGGIHSLKLNQFEHNIPTVVSQGCRQQAASNEQPPNSLLGNFPPHLLALAQQQMTMLNTHQPVPLSTNPALNAHTRPRDDRYGSINYGSNSPNSRGNSPNSRGHSRQGYTGNRRQDNRSRGPRHVNNQTMQAMKSRFEESVAQNSQMLTSLQDRQGRFDMNRVGSRGNSYDDRSQQNRDDHHRSSNRDYRQQPYDRHESHHSRNEDRHTSHDNHRRYDDRNTSSRYDDRNSRYDDRNSRYDDRNRNDDRNSGSRQNNRGNQYDRGNRNSYRR